MFKPKECVDMTGFFEIPGYSRYCINEAGVVFNKITSKVLTGSINPDGYCHYRLTDDLGVTLTYGRHRLLCMVFKYDKRLSDGYSLVVNHKNGIKGDDRLPNLEWTTQLENIHHAGWAGLSDKCQPIAVRDIDTGNVKIYSSIVECARDLKVTKDFVNWRLKAGEERLFPERKQYRSAFKEGPWLEPNQSERDFLNKGTEKPVFTRNLLTGKVKAYAKMSILAYELDMPLSTLTGWLDKNDQPVIPGMLQIKRASDVTAWRVVEDPYLEVELFTKRRVVKTLNVNTGELMVYMSAKECAIANSISVTLLNYRLKKGFDKVHPDGLKYGYYNHVQ